MMISYVLMNGGARFKVNINRPKGQVRFKIKNLRIFVKQPLGWVCFYFYVKEYAYPHYCPLKKWTGLKIK